MNSRVYKRERWLPSGWQHLKYLSSALNLWSLCQSRDSCLLKKSHNFLCFFCFFLNQHSSGEAFRWIMLFCFPHLKRRRCPNSIKGLVVFFVLTEATNPKAGDRHQGDLDSAVHSIFFNVTCPPKASRENLQIWLIQWLWLTKNCDGGHRFKTKY